MRVHGDVIISRRKQVHSQEDYHSYLPELMEDFHNRCGYCGKHEQLTHKGMETDHFVPVAIDHSRECDYYNLVYSCFTCNRKKSKKWPTKDKTISHDDHEGFVDPATPEYDIHLYRSADGDILPLDEVGQYICTKGFAFDRRPMRLIWRATVLYDQFMQLSALISTKAALDQEQYILLTHELEDIRRYLFSAKE